MPRPWDGETRGEPYYSFPGVPEFPTYSSTLNRQLLPTGNATELTGRCPATRFVPRVLILEFAMYKSTTIKEALNKAVRMILTKISILLAAWLVLTQAKSFKNLVKDGMTTEPDEDELDPRVIGGRNAEEGEFPYMAALHYKGRFICSAFLVTPKVIMTAAHCVMFGDEPEDPEDYTGYTGTIHRDGPQQRITFTEIVPHEEYGYSTEYDIALMRLAEPAQLNDKCQTICLPSNNSVYENMTAQVVGWGVTEKWGHEPAKILQTATENVPTYERCEFIYSVLGIPVTRRHICAGGDKDKGVCFGDSGSPLVANETKPVAIGIVSFGSFRGCAAEHVPAVCTATAMYTDWILQNMGDDANDLCFVDRPSSSTPAPSSSASSSSPVSDDSDESSGSDESSDSQESSGSSSGSSPSEPVRKL